MGYAFLKDKYLVGDHINEYFLTCLFSQLPVKVCVCLAMLLISHVVQKN